MNIKDCLKTLADEPTHRAARRVLFGVAARKVEIELLKREFDDRPDLTSIAPEIVSEFGSGLMPETKARLLPIIRSVVDSVFDDDELTGVTEVFKDWEANGRVDDESLLNAVTVPFVKRFRWLLNKQQFDSLKHTVSPAQLLTELFLKLKEHGIPDTLETRQQFYGYWEKAIKNQLIDMQRKEARRGRVIGDKIPLDDILRHLHDSGEHENTLRADPEGWLVILNALEQLPDQQRDAFRYRYLMDLDVKDIVDKMKLSKATVNRRLDMARESLQILLGEGARSKPPEKD